MGSLQQQQSLFAMRKIYIMYINVKDRRAARKE